MICDQMHLPAKALASHRMSYRRAPLFRAIRVGLAVTPLFLGLQSCGPKEDQSPDSTRVEQATAVHDSAPPTYQSTPENDAQLKRFVSSVLTFTLLHEMGHMIVSEYKVPVLGRPEDAADRFAISMLTPTSATDNQPVHPGGASRPYILMSAALFWDALHKGLGQDKQIQAADWADEHGLPEQRAFSIACLLYGSDTVRFSKLAENVQLSADRQASCVDEAQQNQASWATVIKPHLVENQEPGDLLSPHDAIVGTFYHPIDQGVPEQFKGSLTHAMEVAETNKVLESVAESFNRLTPPPATRTQRNRSVILEVLKGMPAGAPATESMFDYRVVGDACLNKDGEPTINALWDRQAKTLILCYGLVAVIENVGKSLIASQQLKF